MFNKKGSLVTIDIKKAFDSVNHNFLIMILEKFGLEIYFSFNGLKFFLTVKSPVFSMQVKKVNILT